jgi:hypothetical protein
MLPPSTCTTFVAPTSAISTQLSKLMLSHNQKLVGGANVVAMVSIDTNGLGQSLCKLVKTSAYLEAMTPTH